MADNIIRIPFKWYAWVMSLHPGIEGIMQVEIGKYRTNHATLRSTAVWRFSRPILPLHVALQPAFNVESNPLFRNVLFYRTPHQFVVYGVKECPDIHVHHPVITPAVPSRLRDGLFGILSRAVTVGRRME